MLAIFGLVLIMLLVYFKYHQLIVDIQKEFKISKAITSFPH